MKLKEYIYLLEEKGFKKTSTPKNTYNLEGLIIINPEAGWIHYNVLAITEIQYRLVLDLEYKLKNVE